MRIDALRSRPAQFPAAARRATSVAQRRGGQQSCRAQRPSFQSWVKQQEEALERQAQALRQPDGLVFPSPIDGRRAESIIERTAAHGDMTETEVLSRLQVTHSTDTTLMLLYVRYVQWH